MASDTGTEAAIQLLAATAASYESQAVSISLFVIEFIVFLVMVGLGAWMGGIGVGLLGAVGVVIFGFGFQMTPGAIAFDVIQIITAAICCVAALEVVGGLNYSTHLINKALRCFPRMLTIIAPLLTFAMTVLAGTGHTGYAALPVIIEVAKDFGIRPSRPVSAAVVSGQMAIVASPISAAVVWFGNEMEKSGISYAKIVSVTIPATLIGTILTSIVCLFLGKDLYKDPVFLRRVAEGTCKLRLPLPPHVEAKVQEIREEIRRAKNSRSGPAATRDRHSDKFGKHDEELRLWEPSFSPDLEDPHPVEKLPSISVLGESVATPKFGWRPKVALVLFLVGMIVVTVYALLISDNIRVFDPVMNRDSAITSVLLLDAALITVVCGGDVKKISNSSVFIAGMVGCVCVLGVAWMGDTFIKWWMPQITDVIGVVLRDQPWLLAIVLFIAGVLMYSQAATVKPLMPIAFKTGVSAEACVGAFPAVCAQFVLPTYPTQIAAALMDDTGSCCSGRFVFDHPMFIPGVLSCIFSSAAAFGLAYAYL